jgi:hypothetical protein
MKQCMTGEFGRKFHRDSSIFHLASSVDQLLCMAGPFTPEIGILPLLPHEKISTAL